MNAPLKGNPFAKKSSVPVNVAPQLVSFDYDGNLNRHRIRLRVPTGFAAKAIAARGWNVGSVFPHKNKNYYVTAVETTDDEVGETLIVLHAVECGVLFNVATNAAASVTPDHKNVVKKANTTPKKAELPSPINPPRRKLLT